MSYCRFWPKLTISDQSSVINIDIVVTTELIGGEHYKQHK